MRSRGRRRTPLPRQRARGRGSCRAAAPARTNVPAVLLAERGGAGLLAFLGVEAPGQIDKACLELGHAHLLRREVHVEQRALLPGLGFDEPSLTAQARVERGPRKSRHDRDLHLGQTGLLDETEHVVEDRGRVAVQAENEAAVDADPVRLYPRDRLLVMFEPIALEVLLLLDSI